LSTSTVVVIPCYNEVQRLPSVHLQEFAAAEPEIGFVLVNDGSSDATLELLRSLEAASPRSFQVIDQQPNRGKAEAVRRGMLAALARRPRYAGYWDADLATPLDELKRFIAVLDRHPERELVFGSRVRLLGRRIDRNPVRHYLGRLFATVVSLALRLPIYDTQCGAKLFRVSDETARLFAAPFRVNWTFDVELIARLAAERHGSDRPPPAQVIYELPLDEWHDVAGSKVKPHDFLKAAIEIARIWFVYLRRLD